MLNALQWIMNEIFIVCLFICWENHPKTVATHNLKAIGFRLTVNIENKVIIRPSNISSLLFCANKTKMCVMLKIVLYFLFARVIIFMLCVHKIKNAYQSGGEMEYWQQSRNTLNKLNDFWLKEFVSILRLFKTFFLFAAVIFVIFSLSPFVFGELDVWFTETPHNRNEFYEFWCATFMPELVHLKIGNRHESSSIQ